MPVCALSGFSPRHVCGYIKPGPRFASTFVVVFFVMFTDFNWEVFVHFPDIFGIVGNHCWNFLFHNNIG